MAERKKIRVFCVSDTHNLHNEIALPPPEDVDLFIHAGDLTAKGTKEEVLSFVKWINKLDYAHKVFIAGNHDIYLDGSGRQYIKRMLSSSVTYLENEQETVMGVSIYGAPNVARNGSPAFARERGAALRQVWRYIPNDTQILVSHMPPAGILDINSQGESCGCLDLRHKVSSLKNLRLHAFGHIHQSKGTTTINDVVFANGAHLQKVNKQTLLFDVYI